MKLIRVEKSKQTIMFSGKHNFTFLFEDNGKPTQTTFRAENRKEADKMFNTWKKKWLK